MNASELRGLMAIHAWPPPSGTASAADQQYMRLKLVRAIEHASRVTPRKLQFQLAAELLSLAAVLGCAVCGKPIKLDELRHCTTTQRSLVHLWGGCSDALAKQLEMTPAQIFNGAGWR